jgi:GNAT superfamily N-acetyltransferase
MQVKRPYEFRAVDSDASELRAYIKLFEDSFGGTSITPKLLDWQYNLNPNGRVVAFDAFLDGELAAHYATIPMMAQLGGRVARGLLSINTATHPRHQRQGLFPRLAEMTYDRGRELGYEFVVGVANHNSVYGFTNKLGFQPVSPLETRIVTSLTTRQSAAATLDYVGEWSAEAVRWRMSKPDGRYSVHRRGQVTQIMGHTRRFPAIVGQVEADRVPDEAESARARLFNIWLGIDSRVKWNRTLQVPIPRRFRPVPLTLIFRDLIGTRQIDPRATAFWSMDFDAY